MKNGEKRAQNTSKIMKIDPQEQEYQEKTQRRTAQREKKMIQKQQKSTKS